MNKKLIPSLAALTIAVIVAIGAGLGLSGALDSEGSNSRPVRTPMPTPSGTSGPTPAAPSGLANSGAPTPGSLDAVDVDSKVAPDPDFREALDRARFFTRGWKTDFRLHSVPFEEIFSGGPGRDGIPPIDNPKFTSISGGNAWLGAKEPVIFLEINGEAKAFPLQILTWHEIVNDVVGGVPVTVIFCPLCNSAIVFDRRLGGEVLDFGVSGNLRNSDLIMWDRQTESWWQQFTGEAIVGQLTGTRLTLVPSSIISWEDYKDAHPGGSVLSRDTGFDRSYGTNPYAGYDRVDNPPFLFDGDLDGRLLPKERVVAATIGNVDAAFPFSILEEERVVNYTVGGQDIVFFFESGTLSALDLRSIQDSRSVGASGIFGAHSNGQKLTFRAKGDQFTDNETGSVWNIVGQAIDGPLRGSELTPIVHGDHFWFAWGAFKPNTKIYRGLSG